MLRKGILAFMITIMAAGGIQAEDGQKSNRLMDFLRGPSIGRPQASARKAVRPQPTGGVTHAVVADAEKQVPEIRQTSNAPEVAQLQPAESAPQPMPVQYDQPREFVSQPSYPPQTIGQPVMVQPSPFHFAASSAYAPGAYAPIPSNGSPVMMGGGNVQGAGALYPGPRPGIPHQVGGSMITNPAFNPHEMMHAHRYKAMYGPFYHKVNGCWILTPFGVWSKENWKLQGTMVDVKYKSHISPFARFCRPVIR